MSDKYRVEVVVTHVTEVIVVTGTPEEASECALQGEGELGDSWHEEPKIARIVKLET